MMILIMILVLVIMMQIPIMIVIGRITLITISTFRSDSSMSNSPIILIIITAEHSNDLLILSLVILLSISNHMDVCR
jgi:hypothetical protein